VGALSDGVAAVEPALGQRQAGAGLDGVEFPNTSHLNSAVAGPAARAKRHSLRWLLTQSKLAASAEERKRNTGDDRADSRAGDHLGGRVVADGNPGPGA
jgi:hypothetical protein